MKCIEQNGTIKRVENEVAHNLVNDGKATYVAKSEWKKSRSVKAENQKDETPPVS